jgi:hypothetical protein
MKKILLLLALIISATTFAQGFTNYKALITDNSGNILSNQNVSVKFTIYDNNPSTTGIQVFQETHTTTTDANGIIVLNIGEANSIDWFGMDWSTPWHYLKIEFDTGSGFVDMGTNMFRTVPYSQYAFKSQYAIYSQHASEVDFGNISNVPTGLADGDDDTQLTDTQITAMGYIKNANDADHDATNEIQTISKNASNVVTLSGSGGSFTDADTHLSETQVDAMVANNGYATQLNDLSDAKTGGFSVYIGGNAGANDGSSNNNNVGIGPSVLYSNTTGYGNAANGVGALYSNTTGDGNVALGYRAGHNNVTGDKNIFLGYRAGYSETGGNKLYIANSDTTTPLIYGDFTSNELTINGSVAIKDGTQAYGKVLVSDANGNASWSNTLPKQTKTINYAANNFTTWSSDDDYIINYSGAYIKSTSTSSKNILMPINLPEGAIITNIKIYYKDDSTSDMKFALRRRDLATGTNYLNNLFTTSTNSSTNQIFEYTSPISILSYTYSISVSNTNGAWGTLGYLRIYGVSITYRY